MQRVLSVRIVKWYMKVLYAAGAWLVGYPVVALVAAVDAPGFVGSVVNTAITLAAFILGARVFRGRGEPVAPRRPWWKMTARPLLSRVLGIVFVLVLAATSATFILAALGEPSSVQSLERLRLPETILSGASAAVLAFLYLNSAVRLGKLPARVREPKFKATLKLR